MAGSGDNSKRGNTKAADFEPVKQALANCVRSIAGDNELEVVFTGDKPGMAANQVRLPWLSDRRPPTVR